MSTLKAGSIATIVLVIFVYLGFTKFALPFKSQYTANVIFQNANQLRPGSLVRVAGVNVGKVNSIQAVPGCKSSSTTPSQCSAAEVSMTIQKVGLPLHKNATFWIRPRIFLEGNFFVDISPGSPSAPVAPSNYVFPISQGRMPVQVDQILTSLQQNTRQNLQILLEQYGQAVKQGGPAYNRSIQYWLPAYQYSSLVEHDALGIEPHDLSNAIYTQGDVSQAINAHPQALQSLITDFDTTARALATQNANLAAAVGDLPATLGVGTSALQALDRDLCSGAPKPGCAEGPLPTLARQLIPAVKSTGPMVDASLPLLSQLRALVQPSELQGLTKDLSVTVPALAKLVVQTIPFMKNGVRPASSCAANEIYPWSQLTLNDPHFNASNGFPPRKVYVEAVDFLPGLAGESRDFDANGPYIRILGALGQTGVTSLQSGLVGGTLEPLVGFQPTLPPGGKNPPLEPTVPCETQPPVSNLTAGSEGAPATETASTAPQSLGLVPLPQLPAGLAADAKSASGSKTVTKASVSRLIAEAREDLIKGQPFAMNDQAPASSSSKSSSSSSSSSKSSTRVETADKPGKKATSG